MSVSSLAGVFGMKRQVAVGQAGVGPYNANSADHVQTLTFSGTAASGNFKLVYDGQTTANIAFGATSSAIDTALEALSNIGAGNIAVTGSVGGPFTVTGSGTNAGKPMKPLTVTANTMATSAPAPVTVAVAQVTDGGTWYWLPALNVQFQPNQIVQSIPAEVGGSLWSRGSYKGGVFGGGQVTMVPRGGLGLAELFYGFCGGQIVETALASDIASGAANKLVGDGSNGVASGNFKYRFIPASAATTLPWYTFIRNVAGVTVEQFPDGHIGNFSMDLAATGILNLDASFTSKSCAVVAKGSGATSVAAQKAGVGVPFQMVDAIVKLDSNVAGNPGATVVNGDYNPTRLNIGFMNELTQNEFVVGSHFLQDITNIARSAQITYSLYLRDAEIYNRVYNHGLGSADGSASAQWSPEIWKGALDTTLVGAQIGASADNYTIAISIPQMDYLAAPISLSGNQLVEFQLSGNVVLAQDPSVEPFTIDYTTNENIK